MKSRVEDDILLSLCNKVTHLLAESFIEHIDELLWVLHALLIEGLAWVKKY